MVYNDRFVTIIGTITMPEINEDLLGGSTEINYPEGFNNENSVVISVMSHNTVRDDWWSTPLNGKIGGSTVMGNQDVVVTLKSDKIRIGSTKGATSEPRRDVTFKITLMKLPELLEGTDYELGDVNGDGAINGEDFNLLNNYMQGNASLTLQQLKAADINKDGKIDAMDSYKLQQYIANGTPFE